MSPPNSQTNSKHISYQMKDVSGQSYQFAIAKCQFCRFEMAFVRLDPVFCARCENPFNKKIFRRYHKSKLILHIEIWFVSALLRCRALSAKPYRWIHRVIILPPQLSTSDRKIARIPPTYILVWKHPTLSISFFSEISIWNLRHLAQRKSYRISHIWMEKYVSVTCTLHTWTFPFHKWIGYAQHPRTDGRNNICATLNVVAIMFVYFCNFCCYGFLRRLFFSRCIYWIPYWTKLLPPEYKWRYLLVVLQTATNLVFQIFDMRNVRYLQCDWMAKLLAFSSSKRMKKET